MIFDPLAVPVRRGLREAGANDAGDAEDEGANVHSLWYRDQRITNE